MFYRNCKVSLAMLLIFMLFSDFIFSDDANITSENSKLLIRLPSVEYPFNLLNFYQFPSMRQSLLFTKGSYQVAHYSINQIFLDFENDIYANISIISFDFFYLFLPIGSAWLHEEWHRAVMSRRGISSYNEVYKFQILAETIAVSRVKDKDLVRLKKEFPRDMIRLHSAGMEADLEFTRAVKMDMFFYNYKPENEYFNIWLNTLNVTFYRDACSSSFVNKKTSQIIKSEGKNVIVRDFYRV